MNWETLLARRGAWAIAYPEGQPVIEWVQARLAVPDFGPAVGLGLMRHRKLVAGVLYNGYTQGNICMHVASDGSRYWMNRQFLWRCFDYPFNQLGCRRVTGFVDAENAEARRFNVHLGFALETRLEKAGANGDILIYRMWREDCKFLKPRSLH